MFFFNATATSEIYTLSLHDALPISVHHALRRRRGSHPQALAASRARPRQPDPQALEPHHRGRRREGSLDRKSTRLNSSHVEISYAVFCLKKKNSFLLYNNQRSNEAA